MDDSIGINGKVQDLRYYIVVIFIYISVFINSYVLIREPFEFYIGYLIYLVLLPVFISRYGFHKNLVAIFSILFVTGIINIFLENNTSAQFFKVFTGLMMAYFFYYYVVVEFNYDIERLFKWYLKGAYFAAVIGVIQFVSFQIGFEPGYNFKLYFFNKWGLIYGGNFGIRINSVFGEPTYLGAVLSSAFFVSFYNMFRKETFYLTKFQSIIIMLVYILSFSGLGQVGIFLTLIFLAVSFGLLRYVVVIIPVSILLFNFLYSNSKDFQERYDSTVDLFTGGKFELGKTHGSSFILYNNYKIALENFKTNFLFGTGIGSHPVAFEKYSLAKHFKVLGFNSNSADANSMLLRLISETGLFGVVIMFFILIKCYVKRSEEYETNHWIISNAIAIMILLNLFRQGHYFLNGFPFFVILYYYNYISYKNYRESNQLVANQETLN